MYNLRNELMHYTNDLPDGADLKAEAVAVIEQIAQYMTKEALLNHSRPLALAYLALTEEVDSVPVVRCKGCKHYRNYPNGLCYLHTEPKTNARGYSGEAVCVEPDDFCSYGERKDGADAEG